MSLSTRNTQQNADLEKNGLPNFPKAKSPVVTLSKPIKASMSNAASEEILSMILTKNSMDGYSKHMLAAGGLSASIACQLISTITTMSPIAGGIAHTFLSVTCVMGLVTFIIHASPLRDSRVEISSVLGYVSLWFAAIGVVVLAWAIQPEPVAIVVTILSSMIVLAMVALSVYLSARKPNPEQNV